MQLSMNVAEARFGDELRDFFTTKIPEDIRQRVRRGEMRFPEDMVTAQQILNAHGLAVPHWPVQWGGRDWSALQRQIWAQEIQLACVPEPLAFNTKMVGPVIAEFGSQQQKERFLAPTANLDIWWCQGFSEPEAGSDLASLRTTAVRDGDDYVVNGQKTWTTLGQHADWIFLLARTDPAAPKRQAGISFLLAEMDTPGITLRPIKLIDGSHEVNEVFFEDVRIPATQLVGEENRGWTYAKFLLNNERSGIAGVGIAKVALAELKKHAAATPMGSGSLLNDPVFATRVAEIETALLALELTQLRVSLSPTDTPVSSILKLRGSQLQQAVSELALEVAGANGLRVVSEVKETETDWSALVGPHYLNIRKTSIFGGTNEVQRNIIAGTILGL